MIKATIQQEDITLVNIYTAHMGIPKHVKQISMDIKGEIDKIQSQLGIFNKETMVLNDLLDQMDLIDIFGAFHPKAAEYIYFSSAHGTFSRIDHMLGHTSQYI